MSLSKRLYEWVCTDCGFTTTTLQCDPQMSRPIEPEDWVYISVYKQLNADGNWATKTLSADHLCKSCWTRIESTWRHRTPPRPAAL